MAHVDSNEKVVVEKNSVNVGGVIAAIALLLLVIGALKYFGVLPF